MGTRVAIHRILRWTVKNASSSAFSPVYCKRSHLPFSRIGCSFLSSSSDQTATPSAQHNQVISPDKPAAELSVSSLLDMGFTDSQARHFYDSVSNVRGRRDAKQVVSTLTALFVLGLNPSSVQLALDKCPELYTVKEAQLQQRIAHLRKLGLVEGSLQRMVVHYPKILTVPVKTVKNVVQFLRQKCLFTTQQITEILRESPAVVLEGQDQLEYKFQYVYFRMGIKQAEMVRCRLFRFSLKEVRNRHAFLERRGFYQTPDKKGQTTIINPKLDSILNVDQDTFVTGVAQASLEEYDVFQRLLAREWKEKDLEQSGIKAHSNDEDNDDDDYEEDDDDEEEEETEGKSGYQKRKKKYGAKRK
ncbi:transcription termination factor 4, mitochondrial [Kryptolebias marmoratus]|uniref:Mitochondrial transcription termination factor 4 n=1 Tax=Kryptolebias marmoratus TaxID=37003 RepID=A0A3Q2ZSS7_KRYMA|nr:transcription termination factor 4, mitochondrial [Kryptolebias marmoratus]